MNSKETGENLQAVISASVTLGKELHAGHMLLLATADLARLGLGSSRPLILINNNTGPRAAGALVRFAADRDLSLEEAATLLSFGKVVPEEIISAYRSREEDAQKVESALQLLDTGSFDIFAGVAERVKESLKTAGFKADLVSEAGFLTLSEEILDRANPEWSKSGFCFIPSEKNLRILQKGGVLTATGKSMISLIGLTNALTKESPLTVCVDGSADTRDAVAGCSFLTGSGNFLQLAGAGVGFMGKMASGSKGEALTLSELVEKFTKASGGRPLSQALRQLVLTRPLTILNAKNPNLADGFYDFRDNESLVAVLLRCSKEAEQFKEEISVLLSKLEDKVGLENKATGSKTSGWLKFLPQKEKILFEITPSEFLKSLSKATSLIEPGEIKKLEDYLLKLELTQRADVGRVIYGALSLGVCDSDDMIDLLVVGGAKRPTGPTKANFSFRSNILPVVAEKGYLEEDLIPQAEGYFTGSKGLFLRQNCLLGQLTSIISFEPEIESLTREDFLRVEKMVKFCIRRLGYEEP